MRILNTQYLSPLRGRVAFGITTAVFTIYIYNNYDNLPSYQELKSRFYERYLKPESTDSEQRCTPPINENTKTPSDTPLAVSLDTKDDGN